MNVEYACRFQFLLLFRMLGLVNKPELTYMQSNLNIEF